MHFDQYAALLIKMAGTGKKKKEPGRNNCPYWTWKLHNRFKIQLL